MAEYPHAFRPGRRPRARHPGVSIGGIIGNRHLVGVRDCGLAAEHAALVDPDRADALLGKALGEEPIGRRGDTERVVAVAVSRA